MYDEIVYFSDTYIRENNTVCTKLVLFNPKLTSEFQFLNTTYSVVSVRLFFKNIFPIHSIKLTQYKNILRDSNLSSGEKKVASQKFSFPFLFTYHQYLRQSASEAEINLLASCKTEQCCQML